MPELPKVADAKSEKLFGYVYGVSGPGMFCFLFVDIVCIVYLYCIYLTVASSRIHNRFLVLRLYICYVMFRCDVIHSRQVSTLKSIEE